MHNNPRTSTSCSQRYSSIYNFYVKLIMSWDQLVLREPIELQAILASFLIYREKQFLTQLLMALEVDFESIRDLSYIARPVLLLMQL